MIELSMLIESKDDTGKISVELRPNDIGATPVEKDVLSGLFPHVAELLNGLLGGEGFRKTESTVSPVLELESSIVDADGVPTSIPMTEEYLRKKGLVEPEGGVEPVNKNSVTIVE